MVGVMALYSDWDFDENVMPEYALPAIVVYDDDDLNPVALLTNRRNSDGN